MIQAQCGNCQKKYAVPDQFAGKKMKCKVCSGVVSIPAAPAALSPEFAPPPLPPASEPAVEEAAPAPPVPAAKKPFGAKPAFKKGAFGGAAGGGAKKGFVPGKKPIGGARPTVPAKRPEPRTRPPEDAEGAEAAGDRAVVGEGKKQEKTLLLVGASLLTLIILCFGYWYFFMGPPKPDKVVKKPKETPAKVEKKAPVEKDEVVSKEENSDEKDAKADETEKPAAAGDALKPVEALDILPANVQVVGYVELGKVINIPFIHSAIEAQLNANSEVASGMSSVGFDPFGSLKTLWLGAVLPPKFGPGVEPDVIAVIDGIFDRQKIGEKLKSWTDAQVESKKEGPFEVFSGKAPDGKPVKLAFVSEEQVLLGSPALFDAALKLVAGGKSVKDNAKLKAITKDFRSQALVWVAGELSKELQDQFAEMVKMDAEEAGPHVETAMVAIDVADDGGLKLDVEASCATDADAKKLHVAAGPRLVVVNQMVPGAGGVKLKPPAGKTVHASLEVPAEVLDKMKAQFGGPGMPLPGTTPDAQPGDKPGEEPATEPATEPGDDKNEKMEKPADGDKPEEKADSKSDEKPEEKTEEKPEEKEEKTEDTDSK